MKTFTILFILLLSVILLNCGTNHEKEGEAAFLDKDYTTAINQYKLALPNSMNKDGVKEKLALSYFYRGEELFTKTRNLKAFAGNFEQAELNLPEYPNEGFNKEYSRILYELGKAYSVSRPANELEEDEFYKNSLDLLNAAIYVDSTNMDAAQLIVKIKDENFNKLLNTAQKYYDQANRTRKVDLYLSSEYYLKQAAEYKPSDPGVASLFKNIKKKTLSVLNYRDGVSLAVLNYSVEKDGILLTIAIKNYLGKPVEFNLSNLMIVARGGIRYGVDDEAMRVRKLFGEELMENTTLDSENPYVEGKIIMDAPGDAKIVYLSYTYGRRQESRKYFP